MDNQLEFSVKIDEQIEEDKIEIPHSLIYTFVENAIKHGLKPKESDRQLEIRVTTNNKTIQIIIKDNGIGRQKSKEFKTTDTGKGLDIIRTIITGYNQLNKRNITYKITDLKDENNEIAGSKVVLLI